MKIIMKYKDRINLVNHPKDTLEEAKIYRIIHPIVQNRDRIPRLPEKIYGEPEISSSFPSILAEVEGENEIEWYISFQPSLFSAIVSSLTLISPLFQVYETHGDVSWQDQSESHSPYWNPDLRIIRIPLLNQSYIDLKPGSAFGDGSHETTRLMLDHISPYVHNKHVIDIGHGNGILTFSAISYGARCGYGLEIDEEAIRLSHDNMNLNNIPSEKARFFLVSVEDERKSFQALIESIPREELVIVMNMTLGDIQEVLRHFSWLFYLPTVVLISGILVPQEQKITKLMQSYGFQMQFKAKNGKWLFFSFISVNASISTL